MSWWFGVLIAGFVAFLGLFVACLVTGGIVVTCCVLGCDCGGLLLCFGFSFC